MKKIFLLSVTVFSIILLQSVAWNQVYGIETPDVIKPKITTQGDIYKISHFETPVFFLVSAVDNVDGKIPVQCDHGKGSIFKVGHTTVRCMATDSSGNEARASFVVTVGYEVVKIPSWFKITTAFWVNQHMTDKEFTQTLEFLIDNEIIHMPYAKLSKDPASEIPIWIKTNSQKWIDGNISDDEFSIGIQWMLEKGLVKI